jgi:hypothetical protein
MEFAYSFSPTIAFASVSHRQTLIQENPNSQLMKRHDRHSLKTIQSAFIPKSSISYNTFSSVYAFKIF